MQAKIPEDAVIATPADEADPKTVPEEPRPWYVDAGVTIVLGGVPLKLVNVNEGRRRLTFTPLPGWPMPDVAKNRYFVKKR